jgi:DNA polymerase I-like protein with 3'-5' exonuclease and polymerase domains
MSLSQLRLNELPVGSDGRNRCLLSPFASRTGRNQPSNSKFIFGPAVWLRGLIRPAPGMAVAYLDYEQQEFGIGASLSGDTAMMSAYSSGDPYLAFAKQAGAVPSDATKQSHADERERFKICALAVQYGMAELSLARKLDDSPARARELLRLHRATYPRYWKWSDAARDFAILNGQIQSVFGWAVHVEENPNPRSLRNFPIQANGSEMLRLACCLALDQGIRVCCPIHDALLIEAPAEEIDEAVRRCQDAMESASRIVLNGFTIRTDTKVIRYPERYMDKRGLAMWQAVSELVGGLDG